MGELLGVYKSPVIPKWLDSHLLPFHNGFKHMTSISSIHSRYPLLIPLLLFCLTHLVYLTRLPIFNDEAIYLDWGYRSLHAPGHLMFSLSDAKPPLGIWLFGLSHSLTPSNVLVSGRFLAVFCGLLTLFGLYKLARLLTSPTTSLLTVFLYSLTPLLVFYNRQALLEAPLTTTFIWSLYLALKINQKPTVRHAAFLTCLFIGSLLIKFSAAILLLSLCLAALALYGYRRTKPRFESAVYLASSAFASLILLIPLFSHPLLNSTMSTLSRYAAFNHSISLSHLTQNWLSLFTVSFFHLTLPFFLAGVIGLIKSFKNPRFHLINLTFLLSLAVLILIATTLNTRYLSPFLILIPLYSAYTLSPLLKHRVGKTLIGLILVLTLSLTLFQNAQPDLLFAFYQRYTPHSQYQDYIASWTSGYGISETIDYLRHQSSQTPLILATRLDAGNPESAMHAYFATNPRVITTYLDQKYFEEDINSFSCLSTSLPFYYVARDGNLAGFDAFLDPVIRFDKPGGLHHVAIYKTHDRCHDNPLHLNLSRTK